MRRTSTAVSPNSGGRGEQVVDAWSLVVRAALDVAPDERGDSEVVLAQLGPFGGVIVVAVDHRSASLSSARSWQQPAAGITSQAAACSR